MLVVGDLASAVAYERNGTTTLFAGFIAAVTAETDVKAGSVNRHMHAAPPCAGVPQALSR